MCRTEILSPSHQLFSLQIHFLYSLLLADVSKHCQGAQHAMSEGNVGTGDLSQKLMFCSM